MSQPHKHSGAAGIFELHDELARYAFAAMSVALDMLEPLLPVPVGCIWRIGARLLPDGRLVCSMPPVQVEIDSLPDAPPMPREYIREQVAEVLTRGRVPCLVLCKGDGGRAWGGVAAVVGRDGPSAAAPMAEQGEVLQ